MKTEPVPPPEIVCVILAAGQGKRMRSSDRHKVCFPIAGVPAILRTVRAMKAAGIRRFLVVVGPLAEQVASTVSAEHPDVAYVFQSQPRGTGHAAACAAEVLKASGYQGDVLVSMGDKVISPRVVSDLVARHAARACDLTLAALPKAGTTSAGRVVTDRQGKVLGIVEVADVRRAAQQRRTVALAGRQLTARQIEGSRLVNASLYLFRAPVLQEAIAALSDNNAQGELYLTDTAEHVAAAGGRVSAMEVADPEDLMTYNTPEELLRIEEVFSRRLSGRRRVVAGEPRLPAKSYRPAGQWLRIFQDKPPALRRALAAAYGEESVVQGRVGAFTAVLRKFIDRYGPDRPALLARAPGRINLMGRHVDHRGGFVNVMAINRELVLAASSRGDDTVRLAHVDEKHFPDRSFRIGELLREADWMDWMDFINSATVRQVLEGARGDWSNYAKAAVLRLQHGCPDRMLSGMDTVVSGDIPMGAGLSSSSAVVVAMAEAAVALNGLDVTPQQFVDLCGEGEWFVGSRGGSADHAAIRSGQRGRVSRVGFFPFRIERNVPFPDGLSLVIANSHVRAAKSAGARHTFNHRVSAYNLAEMILKDRVPLLHGLEHLRDVDPGALGVPPAEIYRAMKSLPEELSRRQAMRLLPKHRDRLQTMFASHDDLAPYRVREVALFGVSECRRSDLFCDLLESGDLEQIGQLMRVSHDGDRVVRHVNGRGAVVRGAGAVVRGAVCRNHATHSLGTRYVVAASKNSDAANHGTPTRTPRRRRHAPSYGDAELDRLMRDVAGEDPLRRRHAALWAQSGRYACSTPEIDHLADLAGAVPGVVGAQLAGAGLGGCVMILVHRPAAADLMAALRRGYYAPNRLPFEAHVCLPVAGSGLLSV